MMRDNNPAWLNILRFVVEHPARLKVLFKKVAKRAAGEKVSGSRENDAWIAANSVPADRVASALNSELWKEALDFGDEFRRSAELLLSNIPYDLGGGSHHVFLYWLTRYLRPKVILETGVAAGWSSRAFLAAIAKNCAGTLYSSDLPYFRLPKPERFVGILVEPELRDNWVLQLDADEVNLPRILDQVTEVDIFHYDSDKMASGRDMAVNLVRAKLAPAGLIIMDDIWNDDWFRNYVTSKGLPHCVLDGRYGLIGELASQFQARNASEL